MNDMIFYTVAAGDDDLIETLLYESESSAIDFKRDQYPFAQASDEQKSELVKDILAMTNAWRRQVTAYILIGADEAKGGGKSFPVGISHHLDEASLQQLINSKTNRPVEFSYRAISFSGLSLGLIAIPPQPRPVFLKKAYGRLIADTVYIRRGSSTTIADPDEVSRMGVAAAEAAAIPIADLQFADPETKAALGHTLEIESTIARLPERSSIAKLRSETEYQRVNPQYYRDYAAYLEDEGLLQPFRLVLLNNGSTVVLNAALEIEYPKDSGLVFADFKKNPPSSDAYAIPTNIAFVRKGALSAEDCGTRWLITAEIGRVPPKGKSYTSQMFVGGRRTDTFTLNARLFADNLPEPASVLLSINVRAYETREITVAELIELADGRPRKRPSARPVR